MLVRFRRSTGARRLGRGLERSSKRLIAGLLELVLGPSPKVDPSEIRDVRRILLVRPNFRMGNTLMSAPLIPAFQKRFPGAEIDYLGADTTEKLLENLPVNRVYCMSRYFVLFPWRLPALLVRLRRRRYDMAIDLSCGWSFSSVIYMRLLGARYRVSAGELAARLCNVLGTRDLVHMYDGALSIARLFNAECRDRPLFVTSEEERRAAVAELGRLGLLDAAGGVLSFAAFFVGGHMKKRWPAANWIALSREAHARGLRPVVFLGPEEAGEGARYRSELPDDIKVVDPMPLRRFAALLERAVLVVTPDSGPMHLASALDVPTIALLTSEFSRDYYAPRGVNDRALIKPSVEEVLDCITRIVRP